MNKEKNSSIKNMIHISISVIASIFAVVVILGEFKSFASYESILGIAGALAGVIIAYAFFIAKILTDRPKIFISYSHGDMEFAEKIYKELSKIPYHILMDKYEIQVGDNIKNKVDEMIKDSNYIVAIISKNSINSTWISTEIEKVQELEKKILPINIDNSIMPEKIQGIMYADFSKSFEKGMSELTKALKVTQENKEIA